MKKTCVFFASIVLFILLFYACEMPNSVRFTSDRFEMNAPMKMGRFNLASILSETLKESFPEGFELYDMIDYKNAQAFLVGYQMDLVKSFNPDDYLKMPEGKKIISPEPITIPPMTTKKAAETYHFFNMDGFFQNMQGQINNDPASTPPSSIPLSTPPLTDNDEQTVTLTPPVNFDPFMVFKTNPAPPPAPADYNFDAVYMQSGGVELSIRLEFDYPLDPDLEHLEITLTGIELKGSDTGNPIGEAGTKTATLNSGNNFTDTITVNFVPGEKIAKIDPPQFILGGITSKYNGTLSPPKAFPFTVVIHPQLKNIALRGAEALKIGRTEEEIPSDIIQNIRMTEIDDMINAQIADKDEEGNPLVGGRFRIESHPPHSEPDIPAPSNTTYCKGLKVGYNIVLRQQPADTIVTPSGGSYSFPDCLDGFELTDTNDSLAGKWISGKELTVNADPNPDPLHDKMSYIVIEADPDTGVSFQLLDNNDEVFLDEGVPVLLQTHKIMPIKMDMGLDIDELALVRWKTDSGILPPINIPPIDFSNMGEESVSFIRSITFSEVKLNIDFTAPVDPPPSSPLTAGGPGLSPELEGRIALQVSCSDLGFNDSDLDEDNKPAHTKVLKNGPDNTFTSKEPIPGDGIELKIHETAKDKAKTVPFKVTLIPVIDGDPDEDAPYIEFGPVSGNEKIEMYLYGQLSVEYTWTKAMVDIQTALEATDAAEGLTGTYPKSGASGNEVDLSKMSKYLSGITIGGIKANIYVSGPKDIVKEIHPSLKFDAKWEKSDGTQDSQPVLNEDYMTASEKLPPLPGKDADGVYSGTELPLGEVAKLTGFDKIIGDFPRNLYFEYKMTMTNPAPVTITPAMLYENEDHQISALLVMMLPLELKTGEQGGSFMIPDLFEENEDGKDLFDRKTPHDTSLFTGVNINSLGMRIDFRRSPLAGARLHFDKGDAEGNKLFGTNGLSLGNGNSLNINFTGAQQKFINDHLIYPDVKFEFPPNRTLSIGRNFLPVRMVITASGSYTLDLDDLGLGN